MTAAAKSSILKTALCALLLCWGLSLSPAAISRENKANVQAVEPSTLSQAQQAYDKARQQYGTSHPQALITGFALATQLAQLGRFTHAMPLYRMLESIFPRVVAPDGPEMARLQADMASVWESAGEATAALTYAKRATELYRHNPASADIQAITAPLQAARLDLETGDIPSAQQTIAFARERLAAQPTSSPSLSLRVQEGAFEVALTSNQLDEARTLVHVIEEAIARGEGDPTEASRARVRLMLREGRWQEAQELLETLERDALTRFERNNLSLANIIYYRAYIHLVRSQYLEADAMLRRALAIYESQLGGNHAIVARTLHNLALVYQELGAYDQAEAFYNRALAILTRNFGPNSAPVASTQLEMVRLHNARHNYARAESTARQGLQILQIVRLPDERPLAIAHTALGYVLQRLNNKKDAIAELEQALDYVRSSRGPDATEFSVPLTHLAELYLDEGQAEKARTAVDRALSIMRRDGMRAPTTEARALTIKAKIAASASRWEESLAAARASSQLLQTRGETAGADAQLGESEQRIARPLYAEHALLAYRYSRAQPANRDAATAESFAAAQGAALSSAARAVSQLTARLSQEASDLGSAVRRYQDLVQDLRAHERLASEFIALPPDARPAGLVAEIESKLASLRAQAATLNNEIAIRFPKYREFARPQPVDLRRLQATLDSDEALVFQLTLDSETLLWLISRNRAEMVRTDLGRDELDALVRRVRKTIVFTGPERLRDFDTEASAEIFRRTLGALTMPLGNFRHLLFILDGPLQSLPPSLLLPSSPPPEARTAYQHLPWLGVTHAISILPTAGSLVLLREQSRPSAASEPFGGFGNPLFGREVGQNRSLDALTLLRTGAPVNRGIFQRIPQLPETAVELETMRRLLGGRPEHLYLAAKATVRNVEQAPLEKFRVITFATHAVAAGEFPGVAEPAIVLAPGSAADPIDNGVLTSSEIARLRLDADWVILSACNTAAPDGTPGADGLSGLAQSFIFAGARTLLVSHWAVASKATVPLTTGAIARLARDPQLPKSEALHQAIQEMVSGKIDPLYSHPAAWAPFVIVGDGWRREQVLSNR